MSATCTTIQQRISPVTCTILEDQRVCTVTCVRSNSAPELHSLVVAFNVSHVPHSPFSRRYRGDLGLLLEALPRACQRAAASATGNFLPATRSAVAALLARSPAATSATAAATATAAGTTAASAAAAGPTEALTLPGLLLCDSFDMGPVVGTEGGALGGGPLAAAVPATAAAAAAAPSGAPSFVGGAGVIGHVLPESVEHGVVVAPRHKLLDALRGILHSQPHPTAAVVFVNDARRVRFPITVIKRLVPAQFTYNDCNRETFCSVAVLSFCVAFFFWLLRVLTR